MRFFVFRCAPTNHRHAPLLVIDRAWNHRVIASRASERHGADYERQAVALAARLNAEHEAA